MTVNLNPASPGFNFRRLTDNKYSLKIQVHRGVLIHDYEQFLLHDGGLQPSIRTIT